MRRQPFFFFYILPNTKNHNKFANKFAYIKNYYYLCALFGAIPVRVRRRPRLLNRKS